MAHYTLTTVTTTAQGTHTGKGPTRGIVGVTSSRLRKPPSSTTTPAPGLAHHRPPDSRRSRPRGPRRTPREDNPSAVEELVPSLLSLAEVQRVLQGLLAESVAINDLGVILVSAQLASGNFHPAIWRAGRLTDVSGLGVDPDGDLVDLNNRGEITGNIRPTDGVARAVIYRSNR